MPLSTRDDSSHFISLSDIMTALMLVFMFISVAMIMQNQQDQKNVQHAKEITKNYEEGKKTLCRELNEDFKNDLANWNAEIKCDKLSIYFDDANVNFSTGSAELQPEFKAHLAEFFPRYVNLIMQNKDNIQEVRIEGYTDSTGKYGQTKRERYFYNMKLSQDRARNVLEYCLTLPNFNDREFDELKELITANGLSFSHIRTDSNKNENRDASRRVEFRILTNADAQMERILNHDK